MLARIQFAANMGLRILFPTTSISMGWMLLFFKTRFVRTDQQHSMDAYQFWVKIFALTFAVLTAFFRSATMLGIMLFGRGRGRGRVGALGPKRRLRHWRALCCESRQRARIADGNFLRRGGGACCCHWLHRLFVLRVLGQSFCLAVLMPRRRHSGLGIAHPVSGFEKRRFQEFRQFQWHAGFGHGLAHASQPLVALDPANGERHVAHS